MKLIVFLEQLLKRLLDIIEYFYLGKVPFFFSLLISNNLDSEQKKRCLELIFRDKRFFYSVEILENILIVFSERTSV